MQIYVRDLKPGHIISPTTNTPPCVVIGVEASVSNTRLVIYATYTKIERACWNGDAKVDIEAPHLTPAQQHADTMLALIKRARGYISDTALDDDVQSLIDLIEPPVPPTADELVAILREVDIFAEANKNTLRATTFDKVHALLKRIPRKDA